MVERHRQAIGGDGIEGERLQRLSDQQHALMHGILRQLPADVVGLHDFRLQGRGPPSLRRRMPFSVPTSLTNCRCGFFSASTTVWMP